MPIRKGNVLYKEEQYAPLIEKWQTLFPGDKNLSEKYNKLIDQLRAENGIVAAVEKICAVERLRNMDRSSPAPLTYLNNFSNIFDFISGYVDEGFIDFYLPFNYVGRDSLEILRESGDVFAAEVPGSRIIVRLFAANFYKDGEIDAEKITSLAESLYLKADKFATYQREEAVARQASPA